MKRLIHTELLKLRTTPVFPIGVAAMAVVAALVTVAVFGAAGHQGNEPLGDHSLAQAVGAPASIVTTVALLLGVLGMAGEYRHQTITTTFLGTPRRREVVASKLVAHAMLGATIATMTIAITAAIAIPWLDSAGVAVHVAGDVMGVAAGLLLSTALYGALGVAVGALVRNQTAAAIVVLVWLLAVEGLLANVFGSPWLVHWLPAGVGGVIVHMHSGDDTMPMWAATMTLVGYVAAFATAGTRFTVNRDVT